MLLYIHERTKQTKPITKGETTMQNTLRLRKCAYIFDSSHSNYFYGTKAQRAAKIATEKAIKEYYDSEKKRSEKIAYTLDSGNNPIIEINGEPHRLNALQIASIDGEPENVINHRRHITAEKVAKVAPHFHQWTSSSLYSNKYKTLEFEFFTGIDDLGYIRVHFKGYHEQFIIDDRTGKLFTSGECGQHKPTTAEYIIDCLGIESKAAKAEFFEIMNAITAEHFEEV